MAELDLLANADPPAIHTSRRLRALVFTTAFPNAMQPVHGVFVLERIRHLAELADVQVVAPIAWYRALGIPLTTTRIPPIGAVFHPRFWYLPKILKPLHGLCLAASAIWQVRRIRNTFDFDLIDAHFAYPDGFAAVLLGKWFRRPVCITLRGTIMYWSRRPLGRWLCNWAIRRAERVIAVAEDLAVRALQGGVPEERVTTIANSVDIDRFKAIDREAARRALGFPIHGRVLVSVGHISPRKGFQRVIRSMPEVLQSYPDTRLVIVGGKGAEHDNSEELHLLTRQLNLSDRVVFAGPKTPEEVALWMAASDVFVLASDFEGCPNVILEAMACGRPIVATKVGDIARMVPSFAGVLFDDPEDRQALVQSLTAALATDWDAQRIRNYVAGQSWDDVAQRVAAQWLLAIEAFAARVPGAMSSGSKVTVAARSHMG